MLILSEIWALWAYEDEELRWYAHLAQMINTVIQVCGTIKASEADWAFAAVVGPVVHASSSVLTWIMSFWAKGYFLLAVFSHVSRCTVTSVGLYEVHTGCVVCTLVVFTVVDIVLTSETLVTGGAVATVTHRLNVNWDIKLVDWISIDPPTI